MGGYGSGRWRLSTKTLTEECLSIDINELNRQSLLQPGLCYSWHWYSIPEEDASILICSCTGRLDLKYTVIVGSITREVNDSVLLSHSTCTYGSRPWFICPGCGTRAGKLYLKNGLFRCRHCHRLVYHSQRQNKISRLLSRIHRIKRKLGGELIVGVSFPCKPKGMHWQTYQKIFLNCKVVEEQVYKAVQETLKLRKLA